MNKIRIIDLLNKIANGEEVPKKILYKYKHLEYDEEYYLTYDRHYECYYDEEGRPIPSLLADNLWNLNDEVEIIEEEENKIPKKIRTWYSVEVKQSDEENVEYANYNFETMYEKINEIIDYLKSKGE